MALSSVRSGDVCPFGQAARGRRDRDGWPCRRASDDGWRITAGTAREPHAWMSEHTTDLSTTGCGDRAAAVSQRIPRQVRHAPAEVPQWNGAMLLEGRRIRAHRE